MSLRFSHPKTKRYSLVHKFIGQIENKPASDRFVLRTIFFVIVGSMIATLVIWNNTFTVPTAVGGGTLVEGLIGTPRFINPALAVTRADQDVTALVYAGLMKISPDGTLVPNLADSVTASADGKTYNIVLRKNLKFQDGTPLTANDVAFTIALIQNPALKSPLRGNWADVSVEVISDTELNIVLHEPYTPFIENFTVGILPKHIWNTLSIEQVPFSKFNTEPIGAGPFAVDHITRNTAGTIERYTLSKFTKNELVKLDAIELRFYQNEDDITAALKNKDIMSSAYLQSKDIKNFADTRSFTTIKEPLPRIFGVFFNQNKSAVLRDTTVRLALNAAIDRTELVNTALSGYGVPTESPVPQATAAVESSSQSSEGSTNASSSIDHAVSILTKGGWVKNANGAWEKRINGQVENLHITIRTANTPLFQETTEVIARAWRELGVEVQVEQYEQSDLLQSVIRPRDFEALLFGLDMSRAVDLYPFWHSSQREDPGLNIAQYANIEVDTLLERARVATSSEERAGANDQIASILSREMPATLLFVPDLVYVLDATVITTPMNTISKPFERFMNVGAWHMNTDPLWPLFR
jgi:peptide/nickel transport system substrate-binding protein